MDPSDHDQNDLGDGVAGGDNRPRHANAPLGDGWLRSVVEHSSEIVTVVDADGTLRYANPAWARVLGHDPEQAVGAMNVLDHVHPDDLAHVLEETEEALTKGGIVTNEAEYRFRCEDGSWRWMQSVGTYLLDDPAVGGVVVVSRDVTERKKAEATLHLQAQLLGAVGEAVIALDTNRRVVYWNRAAEDMYGFSAEEAVGRRLMERVVPEDLRSHAEEIMAGVRAGLGWKGEFVARRKDGTPFPVEATNTPVFGEEGDPVGVVGVLRDVTERKEAEEALRRSEAEVFSVLESITDGFFSLDRELRFAYVNPQAEALLGRSREDLVGETLWEDPTFYPHYLRALAEGETVKFEGYYPPLGAWYGVRAYPFRTGLSVYFQDITERKEAEEEKIKLARRATLRADISAALAGGGSLRDILQRCTEAMVRDLEAAFARIWTLDEGKDVLKLRASAGMYTHTDGFHSRVPLGSFKIGLIAQARLPHLTNDVLGDPRVHDKRWAEREGMVAFAGYPLVVEGKVVGVVALFARHAFSEDTTEVLASVADAIAQGIQRKWTESALLASEERFRLLAENAQDVIYRYRFKPTPGFEYVSPSVNAVVGYPPEEHYADPELHLKIVHPDDRHLIEEVLRNPRSPATIRWYHKDGRVIQTQQLIKLICDEEGELVAVEGIAREVTEAKRAEEELRRGEERFRSLVQNASDTITILDADGGVRYVSPAVERMLGYRPEELTGVRMFGLVHPDDAERALGSFEEVLSDPGGHSPLQFRVPHKDGSWRHMEATLTNLLEDPGVSGVVVNARDTTERKEAEARLREAEERYRTLVERIPAVTFVDRADGSDGSLYVSPQIETMLGYTPEEWMEGRLWRERLHPDDRERVLDSDERFEVRGEPIDEEYRLLAKDGSVVWVREETVLVRGEAGEPLYVQGILTDVTEKKRSEGRLHHQAFHDALTGLPNRRLFVDRLGHALERTRRRKGQAVAVLFMDLDGFKVVNDSLGHDAGDVLLVEVARRLKGCLRPEDTLARFGGDEFVALLEDLQTADDAVRVAERITDELREPFALQGRELYAAASIGVGLGGGTRNPEELLREADTAMYRAKDQGSGYEVFDPAMHERALGRLELENDLRRAIERNEFVVHYQPIVSLQTGGLWGVEALVRWEHPERGLLNPEEFVPVAEESGLVVPMGELVLEEACRRAVEWQGEFPLMPPLAISVNLSGRQLRRPDLPEVIGRALSETGLPACSLGLDITETVYIGALEANTAALDRLRAMGIRISLDDFGSGYSSLSYLKRLPTDILKIDKSFTRGLGMEAEDTAIVQTVVDLAHILGMEVVAEGVETEAQKMLLGMMGCDFAQGYLFSRPLPPEEVPGFLSR